MQGDVRWDKKKLPESNLHVYGKDNIQIKVYNVKGLPKRGDQKTLEKKRLRNKSLEQEL